MIRQTQTGARPGHKPGWLSYWLGMSTLFFIMKLSGPLLGMSRHTRPLMDNLDFGFRLGTAWTVTKFGFDWWLQNPDQPAFRKWLRLFAFSLNAHVVLSVGLWEIQRLIGPPSRFSLLERLVMSALMSAVATTGAGFTAYRARVRTQKEESI